MHCDCKESLLYYCYVRILKAEGTESASLAEGSSVPGSARPRVCNLTNKNECRKLGQTGMFRL